MGWLGEQVREFYMWGWEGQGACSFIIFILTLIFLLPSRKEYGHSELLTHMVGLASQNRCYIDLLVPSRVLFPVS